MRRLLAVGVALAVVSVLALFLWSTVIVPGNEIRFQQTLSEIASRQQAEVVAFQQTIEQRVGEFTSSPDTLRLARRRAREDLAQLGERIQAAVPHAETVAFYWPGEAQGKKDAGETVGFVELTMINRLESGAKVFPEVSRGQNSDRWQIHWVFPVLEPTPSTVSPPDKGHSTDRHSPLAILYLSTSIMGLAAVLSKEDSGLAVTRLTQNIGIQQLPNFLTVGEVSVGEVSMESLSTGSRGRYSSVMVDIPNSHWQLQVRLPQALVANASFFSPGIPIRIPPWVIVLLVTVAVIACALAYYLAGRGRDRFDPLYNTASLKKDKNKRSL